MFSEAASVINSLIRCRIGSPRNYVAHSPIIYLYFRYRTIPRKNNMEQDNLPLRYGKIRSTHKNRTHRKFQLSCNFFHHP